MAKSTTGATWSANKRASNGNSRSNSSSKVQEFFQRPNADNNRYMAATQHWLKTDIVNDEELRMIRAQVFEAIQRKRSELHTEAAAVLRAER